MNFMDFTIIESLLAIINVNRYYFKLKKSE